MTVLVDTDVLAAWINRREDRHEEAVELVDRILEGTWGAPFVTDFVMDEALTLLMVRRAPLRAVDRLLDVARAPLSAGGPVLFPLVRVSDTAFQGAIPLFRRHYGRGLSFTDCSSLSTIAERRFDAIASFDRGFDGLVARVGR